MSEFTVGNKNLLPNGIYLGTWSGWTVVTTDRPGEQIEIDAPAGIRGIERVRVTVDGIAITVTSLEM